MPILLALLAPADAKKPSIAQSEISLSSEECSSLAGSPANPYVVEWDAMQRADLETALNQGVVVVNYTCEGFEVLPDCNVLGDYSWSGVSPKAGMLEMKDARSVQANLGTLVSPVKFKSEFEQGRSLNLATMMIGTRSTTVSKLKKSQLSGSCDGATHFLRRAYLGAFALGTAQAGSVSAAAQMFGQGASAGASSSKSKVTMDGNLKACKAADIHSDEPATDCGALLRLSLLPITDSGEETDGRGCMDGFVWSDDGCYPKGSVDHYLCDTGDLLGCKSQCNKGDTGSCGRYAAALIDTYSEPMDWGRIHLPSANAGDIAKDFGPFESKFEMACMVGEMTACSAVGIAKLAKEDKTSVDEPADAKKIAINAQMGCYGGEPWACQQVSDLWADGMMYDEDDPNSFPMDHKKAQSVLSIGCESGAATACLFLAEHHFITQGFNKHFSKIERSLNVDKNLQRACAGGMLDACTVAGIVNLPKDRCQANLDWLTKKVGDADTDLGIFLDDTVLCPLMEKVVDEDAAKELTASACTQGNEWACAVKTRIEKGK